MAASTFAFAEIPATDATRSREAFGIASAVGSSGQMILIPLDEFFISTSGWAMSLIYMALIAGLIVPLSVAMAGGNKRAVDEHYSQTFKEAINEAATSAWPKYSVANGHRGVASPPISAVRSASRLPRAKLSNTRNRYVNAAATGRPTERNVIQ